MKSNSICDLNKIKINRRFKTDINCQSYILPPILFFNEPKIKSLQIDTPKFEIRVSTYYGAICIEKPISQPGFSILYRSFGSGHQHFPVSVSPNTNAPSRVYTLKNDSHSRFQQIYFNCNLNLQKKRTNHTKKKKNLQYTKANYYYIPILYSTLLPQRI